MSDRFCGSHLTKSFLNLRISPEGRVGYSFRGRGDEVAPLLFNLLDVLFALARHERTTDLSRTQPRLFQLINLIPSSGR